MKKTLLSIFVFYCIFSCSANSGKIKGILWDSLTNQPISAATITVFKMSDSSIANFSFSDKSGVFLVEKLPLNTVLRVLVSHVSYNSYRKEFTLTDEQIELDFDSILFSPSYFELEAVEVNWDKPPIIFHGDTISFNAEAFLNRPGTVVEDLLKRIPGIEFTNNGIKMNGRTVSRILLDGREFFGSDPTMLLKNIPTLMVDQVQVTEEKNRLGKPTNSGNVTINITLKPEAKKGSFGKVFGGYGTTNRYEAGGMWNVFRDTLQVSFLGYGNNLSKAGFSFTDLFNLGGFNRQSVRSIDMSDGGLSLNNASFGGGNGITESYGGGINYSDVLFKKVEFNASYFLGSTNTNLITKSLKSFLITDSAFSSFADFVQNNNGYRHSYSSNLEFEIDSTSEISLSIEGEFTNTNNSQNQIINNIYKVGLGDKNIDNSLKSKFANNQFSSDLDYSKGFGDRLEFEFNHQFEYSDEAGNNSYYQLATIENIVFSNESFNQNRKTNSKISTQNGYAKFIYELNSNWKLITNYMFSIENFSHDVFTEQNPFTSTQFMKIDMLSGILNSNNFSHKPVIGTYYTKSRTIYLGVQGGYKWLNIEANESERYLKRNNTYQNPFLNFYVGRYKQNTRISFNFSREMNMASTEDLFPAINNLDPMNVEMGNFNLKPIIKNTSYFYIFKKFTKPEFDIYLYSNLTINENPIVNMVHYDELGRQISTFSNLSSKSSTREYGGLRINKRFKLSEKWVMPLSIGANNTISENFQILNNKTNQLNFNSFSLSPNITLSKIDKLDFSFSYTQTYNTNKASLTNSKNKNVNHSVSSSIWWQFSERASLDYDYSLNYQPFISSGISTTYNLMNIALNYSVLKDNKGILKLSAFDLFKQNKAISRTVSENYISESESNAVLRYFMLSFVYNMNSLSAKQKSNSTKKETIYWW